MKTLILVIILVIGIAAIVIGLTLLKITNKKIELKEAPYFRKKALLNEAEQVLFFRLIEAMPSYYVLTQVRLADIVGIKKGTNNWQSWQNKINRKSVDFVIVDKTLAILACIELDGKTHELEKRQKADKDKDEALKAANIPIIRIARSKMPSAEEIKASMKTILLHQKIPR